MTETVELTYQPREFVPQETEISDAGGPRRVESAFQQHPKNSAEISLPRPQTLQVAGKPETAPPQGSHNTPFLEALVGDTMHALLSQMPLNTP